MLTDKLFELRQKKKSFSSGLAEVKAFVESRSGSIKEVSDMPGAYDIVLGDESATAFQPYDDIDQFYFET